MDTETQSGEQPASPLQILLIEDTPEDAVAVQRDLARSRRPPFALRRASSWAEAQRALADPAEPLPDVVLLDLHLPDAEGLTLVRAAIDAAPGIPLVIMTGIDQDQVALQALQLGAQDYLVKSEVGGSSLRRAIRHALERHQILESLERATRERIEMKDHLLNHVSHELLTPLSAIYQFIDILRGTLSAQSENVLAQQQKCLDVLLRNAVQLRRMIGDLMEATRIETGKLQLELAVVDVRASLELAVGSALPDAERKELQLTLEAAPDLPPALTDDARLVQILANLLSNAIKFTPSGGRVTVRAERSAESPGRLHVVVIDTGRGISREALPRVFERLYQDPTAASGGGSRKGLGLGLYICQELVAALGGRIWAESELGLGSQVHLELPEYSTERLFAEHLNPHEPAVLLLLRVSRPESGADARAPEEFLSELHATLPRLVLNHFDLILPRRRTPGDEVMAVVARTDAPGAQAMAARFERSIAELRDQQGHRCSVAVQSQPLRSAGSPQSSTAALAAEVEAALAAARRPGPATPA